MRTNICNGGGGQFKNLIIYFVLITLIVMVIIGALVGTSFSLFSYNAPGRKENIIVTGSSKIDQSGANKPVLASNMIPVYYDETNEVWKKADENNMNSSHKWYDYNNKMWANAVTVTSTNRTKYLNSSVGTTIPMNDINTMWVWIPRFSATGDTANYNGGTKASPGAFDITFVDNTKSAHDAFTFGTQKLNGFWVGKFEISHTTLASSTTVNSLGCTTNTCSNANGIIIKPNVASLRYNSASNLFYGILSMKKSGNSFGFDSSVDTHMIKNNEWGAVVYLTQSIYGRCSSSTSCAEVYINNSAKMYTGRSGGNVPGSTPIKGTYTNLTSTTQYNNFGYYTYDGYLLQYNTNNKSTTKDISKVSSTTGNIYGVYDMSGGSYDNVMGVYTDGTRLWSGTNSSSNSGFTGCLGEDCSSTYSGVPYPNTKYYNKYTTESNYTSANLQHAVVETNRWYGDTSSLGGGEYPWMVRGGYYYSSSYEGAFYCGHIIVDDTHLYSSSHAILVK